MMFGQGKQFLGSKFTEKPQTRRDFGMVIP